MIISAIDVSLTGFQVGLSGAVPDRTEWEEPAQDRAILEFVSLLSGLVFKYGGRIIHGAHPTFTPVILRQAQLHATAQEGVLPVTLVMSELWAKTLSSFEVDIFRRSTEFIVVPQVGIGGPEDTLVRNQSLTAMRRHLIQAMNVMVAIGGKLHSTDGKIPGVAEELALAQTRGMASFLVGGLGGMASLLARGRELGGETTLALNNALSDEKNDELLATKDVASCVSIIFDHLISNPSLSTRPLSHLQEPFTSTKSDDDFTSITT